MKIEALRTAQPRRTALTVRSNVRAGFPIPSVLSVNPTQKAAWVQGQATGKHSA